VDATFLHRPMNRWRAEGRTLGASLRRFHSVVVAGGDPDATADVALGIAEAQAAERHVVLGDLSANADRFASLVGDDDPHGLVDAFDYGISLGRVARPVEGQPNLHIAPTGSLAPEYAELLAHPRWPKLIRAFVDSDHALVIVLPLNAPGMEDLVRLADGLVLVDSIVPAKIEPGRVIANVTLRPLALPRAKPPADMTAATPAPNSRAPAIPELRAPASTAAMVPSTVTAKAPVPTPPKVVAKPVAKAGVPPAVSAQTADSRPSITAGRPTGVFQAFAKPAGYGAGISILVAFIVFWLWNQPFGDNEPRTSIAASPEPARQQPAVRKGPKVDPNLENPADSGASVYAVRLLSANTQAGAILKLQEYGTSMPASTYAPVEKAGTTWFEVLTGAFTTRGGADSLLTSLRSAGSLDSLSPGVVVRVPYAVLIDSVRQTTTVDDMVASLRMRSLPVYALVQRNGWVWVLAGAFESRAQADVFCERIRASGQPADVVLRKGRTF
jgi:hypothetical protein